MKRIYQRFPLLIVFPVVALLMVGPVAITTGCGTFGKTTYQATATAGVTVDAAMSAWGRWVKENKPSAANELKVKNAFEKYQKAVSLVADSGVAYLKAKESGLAAGLAQKQIEFNAAVAAASAALSDLTGIITSFGIRL